MDTKEQSKVHLKGEAEFKKYAESRLLMTDIPKEERETLEEQLEYTNQNIERLQSIIDSDIRNT